MSAFINVVCLKSMKRDTTSTFFFQVHGFIFPEVMHIFAEIMHIPAGIMHVFTDFYNFHKTLEKQRIFGE